MYTKQKTNSQELTWILLLIGSNAKLLASSLSIPSYQNLLSTFPNRNIKSNLNLYAQQTVNEAFLKDLQQEKKDQPVPSECLELQAIPKPQMNCAS